MNNNGRKIRSKSLLILIFTVLFFSVTFNSPANYSRAVRFDKTLTSSAIPIASASTPAASSSTPADTTRPLSPDSIKPIRLPRVDTSYRNIRSDTSRYLTIRLRYGRSADTPDYQISKDTMDSEVNYKAADSIVMKVHAQQVMLYSKADVQEREAHLR